MAILPPPYTRKSSPAPSPPHSTMEQQPSRSRSSSGGRSKRSRFFRSLSSSHPKLHARLATLIKSENAVISSYESAGRSRSEIANQLSEWGEHSEDPAINELSDRLAALLRELGTQEVEFAQKLEEYRTLLKKIRNTEESVQPARDHRAKIEEEIARLRYKDPTNLRLVTAEQELVRAEAECLVAEAQLVNVTRETMKMAYTEHMKAVLERAQKQTIIASAGLGLMRLLDDTQISPGHPTPAFDSSHEAAEIILQVKEDLRRYSLDIEPVETASDPYRNRMQAQAAASQSAVKRMKSESALGTRVMSPPLRAGSVPPVPKLEGHPALEGDIHPAFRKGGWGGSMGARTAGGSSKVPYPTSEAPGKVEMIMV